MAQIEIDTPMTGTEVDIANGLSVTGWTDQPSGTAVNCTVTNANDPSWSYSYPACTAGADGNWSTAAADSGDIPPNSGYSFTAIVIVSGDPVSDSTSNVQVIDSDAGGDATITIGTITSAPQAQVSKKKTRALSNLINLPLNGKYDTGLNPASIHVQVLVFIGRRNYSVYSTKNLSSSDVPPDMSSGAWNTTVQIPQRTDRNKRIVIRALLLNGGGVVLGQTSAKQH
jgi:hypothetical protein